MNDNIETGIPYTIFLIEDNQKILFNLKLFLEFNSYSIITATNGLEALNVLKSLQRPPDLILCDIMMPEMDGYEFYKEFSKNPDWAFIPFIFLTAKASPEDIRFGKILGADDYITKPFIDEDLLSSVAGKINRSNKAKLLRKKIEDKILDLMKINQNPSMTKSDKESLFIFLMFWDEIFGPNLKALYPPDVKTSYDIQQIGTQLFQTKVSVYGYVEYYEAQGILLNISNIKQDGYIYFDTTEDNEVRGGKRQFMLCILAPRINYLESLRVDDILREISDLIKSGKNWDIKKYWKRVSETLMTPSIKLID